MKNILVGLYILFTELVYIVALFFIAYFFVKFFWNKEKVATNKGKIKIVEQEKPNKRRVFIVYAALVGIILFVDILCVALNLLPMVATRVYPLQMVETIQEGIYPRFLYNIQIREQEGDNNPDIKFNFLCFYDVKSIEKTIVKNELKKNKTTYFEDKKNEVKENKLNNEIENTVENVIENTVENETTNETTNEVSNKTKNTVKNEVKNNIKNEVTNEVKNEVKNKVDNKIINKTDNKVKENTVSNKLKK